jgi:hypothetical protein
VGIREALAILNLDAGSACAPCIPLIEIRDSVWGRGLRKRWNGERVENQESRNKRAAKGGRSSKNSHDLESIPQP